MIRIRVRVSNDFNSTQKKGVKVKVRECKDGQELSVHVERGKGQGLHEI